MRELFCPFCSVELEFTSVNEFMATDSNWFCPLCKRKYRTRQQISDLAEKQRKKDKKLPKGWSMIEKK